MCWRRIMNQIDLAGKALDEMRACAHGYADQ
jgi:hypothetical protein